MKTTTRSNSKTTAKPSRCAAAKQKPLRRGSGKPHSDVRSPHRRSAFRRNGSGPASEANSDRTASRLASRRGRPIADKREFDVREREERTLPGSLSLRPGTHLAPVPVVMLSCRCPGERANLITLAWAGTINSEPPMLSVSVRPSRHSFDLLRRSGEFVINLVDRPLARACDFCGIRSGRDCDKFAETGLHPLKVEGVEDAPAVAEAPLSLSCKIRQEIPLGSHHLFLAEITACRVREDLLDEKGKLHLEEASLVAYAHGQYMQLGQWLGFFGYSLADAEVFARRAAEYKSYNDSLRARRKSSGSK